MAKDAARPEPTAIDKIPQLCGGWREREVVMAGAFRLAEADKGVLVGHFVAGAVCLDRVFVVTMAMSLGPYLVGRCPEWLSRVYYMRPGKVG